MHGAAYFSYDSRDLCPIRLPKAGRGPGPHANSAAAIRPGVISSPSSRGWRRTSGNWRGNSGSPSRESTPWWARETSPPPAGRRNGGASGRDGRATRASPASNNPAMEWMRVFSHAPGKDSCSRMGPIHRDNLVLPRTGVPPVHARAQSLKLNSSKEGRSAPSGGHLRAVVGVVKPVVLLKTRISAS